MSGTTVDVPAHATVAGRIRGLDVARALAIAGMVAVHIGPTDAGGVGGVLYAVPHGRASLLFALLAGMGVTLLAGGGVGAGSPTTTHGGAVRQLWWRAALLLPAGLLLQRLDHGVLVILQAYAVYFLVAAWALAWRDRTVLTVAVTLAVLGPVIHLAAGAIEPAWFDRSHPAQWGDRPLTVARQLLLTGSYPLVTWAPAVLFGVWLARRDLRSPVMRRWLIVGGAVVAAVAVAVTVGVGDAVTGADTGDAGWAALLDGSPHSQRWPWLLGGIGSASAVLGLCLVLADRWPRTTWPLAALGQLALTFYVGHLLVLAVAEDLLRRDDVGASALVVLATTAVAALGAVAWRAILPRGPLEVLLRLPPRWR